MFYKKTESIGSSKQFKSFYTVVFNYCPICYHQKNINRARRKRKEYLFFLFPLSSFVVILMTMLSFSFISYIEPINVSNSELLLKFLILLLIIVEIFIYLLFFIVIYYAFVIYPKKIKESKIKLKLFLDETGMKDKVTFEKLAYQENSFKKLQGTRYCNQCGSELEIGDSYCDVCGDTTRDEGL